MHAYTCCSRATDDAWKVRSIVVTSAIDVAPL